MKLIFYLMLVLILTSCTSRQLPIPSYSARTSDDNRLRKDGFYQSSTDVGFEVIFTTSNKLIVSWGRYSFKALSDCKKEVKF